MVYAVVRAGGRQEKVSVGTIVTLDRIAGDANGKIQLPAVLLVDGDKVTTDAKALAKVQVTAEILGDLAAAQIDLFRDDIQAADNTLFEIADALVEGRGDFVARRASRHATGGAHDKRHAMAAFPRIGLVAAQGPAGEMAHHFETGDVDVRRTAVVGREDDERVGGEAVFIEGGEDFFPVGLRSTTDGEPRVMGVHAKEAVVLKKTDWLARVNIILLSVSKLNTTAR